MPPTILTATKNAAHFNTEGILIREVDDKLYQVSPSANPFQVFMRSLGAKTPTKSTKCEWYKDQLMPISDAINNVAGYDAAALTFIVDHEEYFRAGQIFVVPRTGETMRVDSVNAGASTITVAARSWGGTAAAPLVDNDPILILGSAEQESGTVPTIKSVDLVNDYNYTQIFKTAYGASGTARAVAAAGGTYGGDWFLNQRRNKAIEHQRAIELQMLFGEREENTGGSEPIRTMGGLRQFITENVVAVGGNLTEPVLKSWMRQLFTEGRGSEQRILLCAPLIAEAISFWAQDKVRVVVDTEKYGMSIKTYFTDFGTLVVRPHWLFSTGVYSGYAYAFDPSYIKLRPLPGRDTQVQYEVQAKGTDQLVDQYLTEISLEVAVPEVHGALTGVTGYM